jgi:hypothetical protein
VAWIPRQQKDAELGSDADGTMSRDQGLGLHLSRLRGSAIFVAIEEEDDACVCLKEVGL